MVRPIQDFFREHKKAAIAFSGGVDSSFLLCAGMNAQADIRAYYVKSAFQPQFELDDAMKLADKLNVPVTVLNIDVLCDPVIVSNPADRCYYCKRRIFQKIQEAAEKDGYELILDGTNATDDPGDRPGMKALQELNVVSPLRECGYTKEMIRAESKDLGLFTWEKPAYACLATRIRTGEEITADKLSSVETCETLLFRLGIKDVRVRIFDGTAKIQVPADHMKTIIANREIISDQFETYFSSVVLDLKARSV